MGKVTRCIRLRAKIESREDDVDLSKARNDLRLAANRLVTRLHVREPVDDEHPQTFAYRAMQGIKGHEPAYVPSTDRRLSSSPILAVATSVYARWKTDAKAVERGEKSLASFRKIPVMFTAAGVTVVDHERISLCAWAKGSPRVEVRVWPTGGEAKRTWGSVVRGELKHGDLRLQVDRLGRWYALLSVSSEVVERNCGRTMGLSVGIGASGQSADSVVLDQDGAEVDRWEYPAPCNIWQLLGQYKRVRREVSASGREAYGLRSGHGRARKLKPLERLSDKHRLRVRDVVRAVAKGIADRCDRLGVSTVAVATPRKSVERQQDGTEDLRPRDRRADIRREFLWRNRTAIIEQLKVKLQERGIGLLELTKKQREAYGHPANSAQALALCAHAAIGRAPPAHDGRRLPAEPEGERGGKTSSSGEMIAASQGPLERSPRSAVTTADPARSRGRANAHKGGTRKRRSKSSPRAKKGGAESQR